MIQLGLIGRNINHSLSSKIHEFAMKSFGVNGSYSLFNLEENDVPNFLNKAWEENFHGFNVTSPHKKVVAELVGNKVLSAVNTLRRSESGWDSFSTDGEGFARGLERMGCQIKQFSKVLILGSGGVLPALLSCFMESLPEVYVMRRSSTHDAPLSALYPKIRFLPWEPSYAQELLKDAGQDTLFIQASSAPLYGESLQSFIPALDDFTGYFVDLVYGKASQLYFYAKDRKIPCQEGLPMLIEQARLAQEIWFGRSISFEAMWDLLTE